MADSDSPLTKEDPNSGPSESQWPIPFDAHQDIGWDKPTTAEESATTKISTLQTWGDLEAILSALTTTTY